MKDSYYRKNRLRWIKLNGSDEGFDQWYKKQLRRTKPRVRLENGTVKCVNGSATNV